VKADDTSVLVDKSLKPCYTVLGYCWWRLPSHQLPQHCSVHCVRKSNLLDITQRHFVINNNSSTKNILQQNLAIASTIY